MAKPEMPDEPSTRKAVDPERAQRLRTRAYELWEEAGRPDGDTERFWFMAEQELAAAGEGVRAPDTLRNPPLAHDERYEKGD